MSDPETIQKILDLPLKWHGAGSLSPSVLEAIVKHSKGLDVRHSLETGSGKSTLIFSHISADHTVFALDKGNKSIQNVKQSPLFNSKAVRFVDGPTQKTLRDFTFESSLQIALIDGPHGYPFPDLEYYYIYPHLEEGGLLILDDIDIPMIYNLFGFIRRDEMFSLLEVKFKTAFFRRTGAPVFDPLGDGWWVQGYNKRRLPFRSAPGFMRWILPGSVKEAFWRIWNRRFS